MVSYILTGCGLLSLVAFLIKRDKNSSIIAIALKTLTSVLFIATGIFSVNLNNNNPIFLLSSLLVIFGLVFGLIGDIILDFKIFFKARENSLSDLVYAKDGSMYIGMVAFGLGHISYLFSILIRYPNEYFHLIISIVLGLIIMLLVIFSCEKIMKMNYSKFRLISILYGGLLAGFVIFTLIINIKYRGINSLLLLLGSIMFIVSDLILSMTYFSKEEDYKKMGIMNPESRLFISLNHITYYIAQFLIALSILFI